MTGNQLGAVHVCVAPAKLNCEEGDRFWNLKELNNSLYFQKVLYVDFRQKLLHFLSKSNDSNMHKGGSINLCAFRNSNNVQIKVGGWSRNCGLFKLENGKKCTRPKNKNFNAKMVQNLFGNLKGFLYAFLGKYQTQYVIS